MSLAAQNSADHPLAGSGAPSSDEQVRSAQGFGFSFSPFQVLLSSIQIPFCGVTRHVNLIPGPGSNCTPRSGSYSAGNHWTIREAPQIS